jgi:hypothetical protein
MPLDNHVASLAEPEQVGEEEVESVQTTEPAIPSDDNTSES